MWYPSFIGKFRIYEYRIYCHFHETFKRKFREKYGDERVFRFMRAVLLSFNPDEKDAGNLVEFWNQVNNDEGTTPPLEELNITYNALLDFYVKNIRDRGDETHQGTYRGSYDDLKADIRNFNENPQSKKFTDCHFPVYISFKDSERYFTDEFKDFAARAPKNCNFAVMNLFKDLGWSYRRMRKEKCYCIRLNEDKSNCRCGYYEFKLNEDSDSDSE